MFRYYSLGGETAMPSGLYARLCHAFLVLFFMIPWKPIISGSIGPEIIGFQGSIFDFFSPYGRYLIVVLGSGPFFRLLKGCCQSNQFRPKFAKDLHSTCWRSEMGWKNEMPMLAMKGAMIRLHCVEIWYTSVG